MSLCFQFVLSLLVCSNIFKTSAETEGYGPYSIEYRDYKLVGSTASEVKVDASVKCEQGQQHCSVLYNNFTFIAPVVIDMAKIELNRIQNGEKLPIMHKTLRKPCTSMYYKVIAQFIPAFRDNFAYSKGNCVMKKGSYAFKVDMSGPFEMVLGSQFYYGEYVFRFWLSRKSKIIYRLVSHFKIVERTN